eukprot:642460-Prorocentrum_lima.AAC.1
MPEPGGALPQLAEAREASLGNKGGEGRETRLPEDLLVGKVGVSQWRPGRPEKPEGKEEGDV